MKWYTVQDGDHAYIRLNFNFGPTFEPGVKFPQAIFLKELSYRTSDTRHATKACLSAAVSKNKSHLVAWDSLQTSRMPCCFQLALQLMLQCGPLSDACIAGQGGASRSGGLDLEAAMPPQRPTNSQKLMIAHFVTCIIVTVCACGGCR